MLIYNEGFIHGTIYHIIYESPNGENLKESIELEMKRFDHSLSTFQPNSIISRINQNDTTVVTDVLFDSVYHMAQKVSELTNGAFDITVAPLVNLWGFGFKNEDNVTPAKIDSIKKFVGFKSINLYQHKIIKEDPRTMLDCSAIAKGFSVDIVCSYLDLKGCDNYMVDIGGEIRTKGKNRENKWWRIGINKPIDDPGNISSEIESVIKLPNKAIATSGNYRNFYIKDGKKYAHTIDPSTGYPVEHNLLSVSIIAKNCMMADAFATACMVLGLEKSLLLVKNIDEIEGFFIFADENHKNKVIFTEGFEQFIVK